MIVVHVNSACVVSTHLVPSQKKEEDVCDRRGELLLNEIIKLSPHEC